MPFTSARPLRAGFGISPAIDKFFHASAGGAAQSATLRTYVNMTRSYLSDPECVRFVVDAPPPLVCGPAPRRLCEGRAFELAEHRADRLHAPQLSLEEAVLARLGARPRGDARRVGDVVR